MPGDNHKPSLLDVVLEAIRFELAKVHTSIPGHVVAYDAAEQRATIQPAIRGCYIDPDTRALIREDLPQIPDVPVAFPGADGFSITFDVAVGDPVLVVFMERSTEEFRATGESGIEPGDLRRFDMSDAVAFPTSLNFAEPIPAEGIAAGATVVRGVEVRLGDATATQYVALAPLVEAQFSILKSALDAAAAAAVAAAVPSDGGVVAFSTFKSTLAASLAAFPGSTAASKVKAL